VLVGGGHAHVQVIRRWMMRPLAGVRLTVVLDRPEAVYSGMVPGFVAGDYAARELEIDVVPLARRAGARVVLAAATGLDPKAKRIALEGRPALSYDVASLDVGSTVRGLDLPGVREHALATRPIRSFVDRLEARLAVAGGGDPLRVVVVGAGAAGVELSFTLEARLRSAGRSARVALIGDSRELLPGASRGLARAAEAEARRRGIAVRLEARVARVREGALELVGEREPLSCDLAVWATGAAPPALLAAVAAPRDGDGFVRVSETLQSVASEDLFAVGDCAALDAHAWLPKAGVYAVREGPLLDHNLRARLEGRTLQSYRPQRDFLALLNLGERRALGGKWGIAASGAAVWRLKDAIDRRFVARFQVLDRAGAPALAFPASEMGESMACGGCAAKVDPDALARALAGLPPAARDDAVWVGLDRPDDAAALRLPGGDVVLATVDGFRAFADDPWLVGRVAAVNALSDVYAKGGRARFALAWVSVPDTERRRPAETLAQVLAGVRAALDPLGVTLVGGHSTTGAELWVGLAVLGELPRDTAPLGLAGLRVGEQLILSKPLGTGVVLAADMAGRAAGAWALAAHASMLRANARAAGLARELGALACTDVSGFGLANHLGTLLRASGVGAALDAAALPALPGARALFAQGVRSSFHAQNLAAASAWLDAPAAERTPSGPLLFDPQTSGGLLFAVAPARAEKALARLRDAGEEAAAIGDVMPGPPRIELRG